MHYRNATVALLCLLGLHAPVFGANMIPFTLPWDADAESITDLSHLLEAPAGQHGYVAISEDGHYTLNGERIRFFGVNIGAGSCFPETDISHTIARRLARFGFNIVRFHHMDNGWDESIIDYATGNSKNLNTEHLDRFDRLFYELKQAGIYANLNLLCSRRFLAADGLHPEVDAMDWKETHILGMFDEGPRNLQKEYALKLLTHVNPYTGLSYAEDPAVAVVEINNENGLLHMWHSGALDRMPKHYRIRLRESWNAWLQNQYENTDQLLDAWQAIDVPLGESILQNGGFRDGDTGWNLENHQNAIAAFATNDHFNGQRAARITIEQLGSEGWHVQFNHPGLELVKDQIYTLRFWIRASSERGVAIAAMQAHDPWQSLGLQTNITVDSQWQQWTFSFVASDNEPNARINFGNLGSALGWVEIAQVEWMSGGSIGTLPEGHSLEAGNVPNVPSGADPLPAVKRDWLSFLHDTESEYWQDMDHFVRAIGYQGLTWGTTIMNSSPHMQDVFHSTDSHAYWQHPHFPGAPWDPNNWTIPNISMVNDADGGVIPTLSWQRVKGKPHNVTEYQHPSPNTYSSEAPLFAAAYGCLQDWDGIYLFGYGSSNDDWDRGYFINYFDTDTHSSKMANAAIAALMFRRLDIQPAPEVHTIDWDPATELEIIRTEGGAWNVGDARHLNLPAHLPLMQRVQMDLQPDASDTGATTQPEIPPAPESMVFSPAHGELNWDLSLGLRGVVTVDTDRTKGIWGFPAGRSWDFGSLQLRVGPTMQDWATVMLTWVEGNGFQDLRSGGRGLIVCTGNTENTHMGWTDATRTSVGSQWGQPPVLVENVPVDLTFPIDASLLRVWALDPSGVRTHSLPITPSGGGAHVQLGGEMGSLWYEFEVLSHP